MEARKAYVSARGSRENYANVRPLARHEHRTVSMRLLPCGWLGLHAWITCLGGSGQGTVSSDHDDHRDVRFDVRGSVG
jgi:hypothetical protein